MPIERVIYRADRRYDANSSSLRPDPTIAPIFHFAELNQR